MEYFSPGVTQIAAAGALAQRGSVFVPRLIELTGFGWEIGNAAIKALGRMGVFSPDALSQVLAFADSSERPHRRELALTAVGGLAHDAPASAADTALQVLTDALDDPQISPRTAAAKGIGLLGAHAMSAAESLRAKLDTWAWNDATDELVRTITRLGPHVADLRPNVKARLDKTSNNRRYRRTSLSSALHALSV